MRLIARVALLFTVVAAGAFAGDQYLLRTPSANLGDVTARHGLTVVRSLGVPTKDLFLVEAKAGVDARKVLSDNAVTGFAPNGAVYLPETDPYARQHSSTSLSGLPSYSKASLYGSTVLNAYIDQPALSVIGLSGARWLNATGAGVVAVLDTGVDPNHPAFNGKLLAGYDFTRNVSGGSEMRDISAQMAALLNQSTTAILDQSTTAILDKLRSIQLNQSTTAILDQSTTAILDQSTTAILDKSKIPAAFGHGTMVAGIVHLIAPTAKILPVKVFAADGSTTMATIVAGVYWAVAQGADVIQMSFSTASDSKDLQTALTYAMSKGVVCVASVGNDGASAVVYPAGESRIIGVGSTNNYMVRSQFSDYGSSVDLAAPGEQIITLYPGGNYAAGWGTSFAAPFVSGAAALLEDLAWQTNQSQASNALDQATPIGQQLGAGELNLYWACWYRLTHGY